MGLILQLVKHLNSLISSYYVLVKYKYGDLFKAKHKL